MNFKNRLLNSSSLNTTILIASLAGAVAIPAGSAHAIDPNTTPSGGNVVGGQADISKPSNNVLNVDQHTNRAVIDWQSFNIGKDAKAEFFQPGTGSLAVNRVVGGHGDPTKILGQLKANGQLMVLDQNGIFFGRNSVIDTNGIIASTGTVNTAQVMSGANKIELSNFGSGEIVMNGTVNVAQAGLAAFVSPTVKNNGVINARLGKVAFGAGSKVTVDLYGDQLIEIAVDNKTEEALLENTGQINAQGGSVALTANAAKGLVDNVINMEGVTRVSSVEQKGGKIVLLGGESGTVRVAGEMDASGKQGGGEIDVRGLDIDVMQDATVNANAIDNGDGGEIIAFADKNGFFAGDFLARGGLNGGDGGFIETSGNFVDLGDGVRIETSSMNGQTGSWLIDPVDVLIVSSSAGSIPGNNIFDDGAGNTTQLGWDVIETALHDNNVTITTLSSSGTNDGDIKIQDSNTFNSGNDLTLLAHEAVRIDQNVAVVNEGLGDFEFWGGWNGDVPHPGFNNSITDANKGRMNFRADSQLKTGGDINLYARNKFEAFSGFKMEADNITVVTDRYVADTSSNNAASVKANGEVAIHRNRTGLVSLGNDNGGLRLDVKELSNIIADELVIGNPNADDSNIREIRVDGVSESSNNQIGHVTLNALRSGGDTDVEFIGNDSTFQALTAKASDDIVFRNSVKLETKEGDIALYADTDADLSTGDTNVIEDRGGNVSIISAGDIVLSGRDYRVRATTVEAKGLANDGNGKVSFFRSSDGYLNLGDGDVNVQEQKYGHLTIDGDELDVIDAPQMVFGHNNPDKNKVLELNVKNVDLDDSDVTLNAFKDGHRFGDDVEFDGGDNIFGSLEANAGTDIVFRNNAKVETMDGDIVLNAKRDIKVRKANAPSIITSSDNILFNASRINIKNGTVVKAQSSIDSSIDFNANKVNLDGDLDAPNITGNAATVYVNTDNKVNNEQIQDGVDVADSVSSGETAPIVYVGPGTFNETVVVNKSVSIIGDETGTTTIQGTPGESSFDDYPNTRGIQIGNHPNSNDLNYLELSNMVIEKFEYGIEVDNRVEVTNLVLNDIKSENNKVGFKVTKNGRIDTLTVDDSHFDDNKFGWFFSEASNDVDGQNIPYVTVENTTFNNNEKGISAAQLDKATFTDVIMKNNIDGGIFMNLNGDVNEFTLKGSTIEGKDGEENKYGLKVGGATSEGTISLVGNVFANNKTGARFESGLIDISDEANRFNGGDVGMLFNGTDVKLAGNTLGTTIFSGQSDYYVKLENDALFISGTPGTPNVTINGQNATYNNLSLLNQIDEIEDKVIDFDDNNNLGQIFVGNRLVDSQTNQVDLKDIFATSIEAVGGRDGDLILTVNGLPNTVPGGAANVTGPITAQQAAGLEPAAGGDDDENEAVTNYANCWAEVISGGSYNLVLGNNQSNEGC